MYKSPKSSNERNFLVIGFNLLRNRFTATVFVRLIQFQAGHKLGNINFGSLKFELEFAANSGNISVGEDFLNRGAARRRLSQTSVG